MNSAQDPDHGYFDFNGSTPVHSEVSELDQRLQREVFANASAAHRGGAVAREWIERARLQVAQGIGARPEEIWFTSGGTESNDWALFGSAAQSDRRHLVVSAIEHKSVLASARELERRGYELDVVPPRPDGAVHVRDIEAAVRDDTFLVSVMWANNETGIVQPVAAIADLCRSRGVRFHTDAVCVLGKLGIDVRKVACDLLSLSSHKLYAPKGVGALYVRSGQAIAPFMFGCGQQQGLRSGSENTHGIAAFGRAVSLMQAGALEPRVSYESLRRKLWQGIEARFAGAEVNGHGGRIPNTLSVHFPGVSAVELQAELSKEGFSVGAGASASGGAPSHVLLAMGLSEERARGSLRFSLGRTTAPEAIDALLAALERAHAACTRSLSLEV